MPEKMGSWIVMPMKSPLMVVILQAATSSFEWFNASGSSISDQATIQVSESGTFTLVVTNTQSQCTDQSTVEVVPDDNLPTALASPEGELNCTETQIIIDGSGSTSASGNISFEWLDEAGNTISIDENTTVGAPGDYTLIVTDTDNGCSIATTVTVNQDVTPPLADAGQNQVLTCSQNDITLDGSASMGQNLSYEWQDNDGNIIENSATATVSAGGIYTLIVTNNDNGCSASSDVEVIPDTNLPTANAGMDVTLNCNTSQWTLDGSASSSGQNIEYEWQDEGGNTISSSQTTVINTPGTYTLIVLDTDNNCQAQDEVVITEDITPPVPDINYTSNQEIDCNNSTIILDATGSAPFGVLDFEWETSNGVILSGGSTSNPEFGQAGTYVLTITNTENGCTNSQSIEITANLEIPTVLINTPQILTCITDEIELDATNSSTGNFSYSWSSNPSGGIISGENTLQPTINQPGIYELTVFNNENGCENTAEIEVLENTAPPIAMADTEEEFDCITESITLSGEGSSIGSEFIYQWSGNGTIDNETA